MKMNQIKLKLCPFCDSEAKMNMAKDADGYKLQFYVSCMTCYARTRAFGNEDMAVKAWNHRSGSQTYKEYFEEHFPRDAFPEADVDEIISELRVCQLWGKEHVATDCEAIFCATHWDREMP